MTYEPDIFNFIPLHPGNSGQFDNLLASYAGWLEITNTSAFVTVFSASSAYVGPSTKYVYPGMRSYLYVAPEENAHTIYWNVGQALYDDSLGPPIIPIDGKIKVCGYTLDTPPVTTTDTFILTNLVGQNYQLNNFEENQIYKSDGEGTINFVSDTSTTTNFRFYIIPGRPWPGGFINSACIKLSAFTNDSQFRMMLFDTTGNILWFSNLHTLYKRDGSAPQSLQRFNVNMLVPEQERIYLGAWIDKTISGYEYDTFTSTNDKLALDNINNYGAPINVNPATRLISPYWEIVYQNKVVFGSL